VLASEILRPAQRTRLRETGVVAIGRNEGERLRRCLDALPKDFLGHVVYVDSGSNDDSVAEARRRGFDVLELDMSIPFTAARARNAGLRRLREQAPGLRFVQLVDGDCALQPGWLETALDELESDRSLALVCGRRREVHAHASIYNRLCDIEWDTPLGEAEGCGGDALARLAPLLEVGGYDEGLICGEEPELCARLRARGWRIRRIAHEMTLHDAAMTRFVQWWKRSVRTGHGYAEFSARRLTLWRRRLWSILAWALVLPMVALGSSPFTRGLGLALLLAYPALWLRIVGRRRARGARFGDAALYASFCILGKFPELAGTFKYWWNSGLGRRTRLIEYK
jgi:GT2 family glycosyltransferase